MSEHKLDYLEAVKALNKGRCEGNDSIEAVVLDDEVKALKEMKELSDKDFKIHSFNYSARSDYDHQVFWHLHEVGVL